MEQKGDKRPVGTKKSASAKKQAEYVRFMFITIVVGIIICIVVFFAVFSSINNKNKKDVTTEQSTETTEESLDLSEEDLETLAVIISISSNDKKIGLYTIEKEKEISLVMKAGASMKDQYGQTMALSQFVVGDIVQVGYNQKDMKYSDLKISSKSWVEKSVAGLKVNVENKTITFGNKLYKYNDKLVAKYIDEFFDVAEMDPMDVVTIKGYNDVVWSVKLEKSHGTLSIVDNKSIKDGTIEIDTTLFKTLSEAGKITVSEGVHKLVVKGSNIESYTKDIIIEKGAETKVDLKDIKFKEATIIVKTNVTDYKLYINDGEINLNEPLTLGYGTYSIKLIKEGYEDLTKEVIVNSDHVNLEIEMKKIVVETEKETQNTAKMGSVTVDTGEVVGASVYVDNAYLGITPLTVKVEYGTHTITVKKEGYTDISVPATIDEQPKKYGITMHMTSTLGQ